MAEGTELGKAYVQIIPSAKGISGKIKEALGDYAVIDNPPRKGKDYNEYLQIRQRAMRQDRARA